MEPWKQICKYCKYYSYWIGDCTRNGSEYYADIVSFDTTCDLWEQEEEDED